MPFDVCAAAAVVSERVSKNSMERYGIGRGLRRE
jgi:hypothetical protein